MRLPALEILGTIIRQKRVVMLLARLILRGGGAADSVLLVSLEESPQHPAVHTALIRLLAVIRKAVVLDCRKVLKLLHHVIGGGISHRAKLSGLFGFFGFLLPLLIGQFRRRLLLHRCAGRRGLGRNSGNLLLGMCVQGNVDLLILCLDKVLHRRRRDLLRIWLNLQGRILNLQRCILHHMDLLISLGLRVYLILWRRLSFPRHYRSSSRLLMYSGVTASRYRTYIQDTGFALGISVEINSLDVWFIV